MSIKLTDNYHIYRGALCIVDCLWAYVSNVGSALLLSIIMFNWTLCMLCGIFCLSQIIIVLD